MLRLVEGSLNSIALLLLPSSSSLLEGVDAEWIVDDLSSRNSLTLPTLLVILITLLLPGERDTSGSRVPYPIAGLAWPPLVLTIPLVFLLPLSLLIVSRVFFYYSSLIDPSTKRLFSSLKARQAAAFR